MSDKLMDVVVGVYKDVDSAQKDFDGLVGLVKDKTVKIEGAILVSKDADGNVTIADTGNHLGRKGAGWGGGVGVIVGLFAPAMLPGDRGGSCSRRHRRQVRKPQGQVRDSGQDRREPPERFGGGHRHGLRRPALPHRAGACRARWPSRSPSPMRAASGS